MAKLVSNFHLPLVTHYALAALLHCTARGKLNMNSLKIKKKEKAPSDQRQQV